jgi:hypothetical protein
VVRKQLQDKDIVCLKHLQRAFELLEPLHHVGCARDKAANRELFFDDYVKLVLLYVWNPLIQSIHDLQQAVGLPKVAKALGVGRFSAGSFSESVRVFDPQRLKPIITELAGQLTPYAKDPRLSELKQTLTLVDGTVLAALPRLARAAAGADARYTTARDGRACYAWRLHTQFDLDTFSPHRIDRTPGRNAGANRESRVLAAALEAGRCYVGDGGFNDRRLFDDVVDAGSCYVFRAAENAVCDVLEERLLSQAALEAGITRDALVTLSGAGTEPTRHAVRRIEVQVEPHPRRTRSIRNGGGGTRRGTRVSDLIILHTNLLDLPAELVALIYRHRYTVELFFRVFKQLLGMRHLLSQRQEGIDVQVYCTVIVCLLIQLISGKKPNKAMRNIVGWYLIGLADAQDVVAFVNKPDNTGVKLRAKEELWKKPGY